jgi:transposase
MKQDVITMTRKQLNILDIINKANAGFITVKEAAQSTGLSERQIQRLKKEVRQEGAAALVHKNSLKIPHNKIPDEITAKILAMKRTPPFDRANFNHFKELVYEHAGIEISYSSLYRLLKSEGIDSPKKRRRFKPHRRRKRRPQAGLLLQVDATPFAWFDKDRKQYSLHGAIDDATGQITGLYMCKHECLQGYFEMLQRTVSNFGIPVSIYADRHTIFQSPNKAKAVFDSSITVNDTQLGRALKELSVELIAARSPQAKGRIERLWATLQDRLPVEFAIRDITTIDAANEFLKTYIYAFNSEFAVEPQDSDNMFVKADESLNIDYILCIKQTRIIDSGGVISYNGKSFKITETVHSGMIPPNAKVNVLLSTRFGVKVEYRTIIFDVCPYVPAKKQTVKKSDVKPPAAPKPVPDEHYYKYGQLLFPKLAFTESQGEILTMLNDIFLRKYA